MTHTPEKQMDCFHYQKGELFAEEVPLSKIAEQVGTPCYVYSYTELKQQWQTLDKALGDLPHRICYAVKANSNIAILNIFSRLGSGFDIVSIGELERVLAADGDPKKIIFSGVGKQTAEIIRALEVGIYCFNVESEAELNRLLDIAKKQKKIIPIALRINPNIDARTHPYIATGLHENKFGIELNRVLPLARKIKTNSHIKLLGIGCHIGSQLTQLSPFTSAIYCLIDLYEKIKNEGITLEHLDIGGGLGVTYQNEQPPTIAEYAAVLRSKFKKYPIEIIVEPGRVLTANAGVLLTRVEYLKHNHQKNFAIVDAAMNDFLRPALYNAWQNIIPVIPHNKAEEKDYDIVGPVCESADFLGKNRLLALQEGDLLAICSAGAYGFAMSSNYNSRPRAAEVLVKKNKFHIIRQREKINELFAQETMLKEKTDGF